MNRKEEIRSLLQLSPEDVRNRTGNHLIVCRDVEALYERMADDILSEIRSSAAEQKPLRLILPVGPTGQYPILANRINAEQLTLEHCWFFFMDEYCDENGLALPSEHPLSFKGIARTQFFDVLDDSVNLIPKQVNFPDQDNIQHLSSQIQALGGIDTCYGGIGIHGHVAFNEPEADVHMSSCRRVDLNKFTITINAIRSQVGGNLEAFPRQAYTLGMQEILSANRIRLYCRSGIGFDWANTVLRLALLGEPGDDYPVTYVRNRDYVIVTEEATLQSPVNII